MNALHVTFLIFALAFAICNADETNLTLTVDGDTYSNVTFGTVTPSSVSIRHSSGIATVPLAKLPVELQERFRYDPEKAAGWQREQQQKHLEQEAAHREKEAAKIEAEVREHTYSVKILVAGIHSIRDNTEMIVTAFTDGRMHSMSAPKGYSQFTITDEQGTIFSGAICVSGESVFDFLLKVNRKQAFTLFGHKWDYYPYYSAGTEPEQYFLVNDIRPVIANH